MPHMDHLIGKEIPVKKVLAVTLEDGDNILPAIRVAMKENNVPECKALEVSGTVKEATLSFHDGDRQRYKTLKDTELLRATGSLKLSYGELYGSLAITTADKIPVKGELVRGTAATPLKFKFSFVPNQKSD